MTSCEYTSTQTPHHELVLSSTPCGCQIHSTFYSHCTFHQVYPLLIFRKHQREDPLNKAQFVESTCGTTSPQTATLTTSTPSTAPTKNIKKKFGDFFAFKKVRAGRGTKSEGASEGKVKKTSIADLIRPLREAARAEKEREKEKERDKEKEREKEKEKERGKVEDESIHKAPSTTPTITDSSPTVPTVDDKMAPSPLFMPLPALSAAPASTPGPPVSSPAKPEGVPTLPPVAPPTPTKTQSPVTTVLPLEGEKSRTLEKSRTPDGERRPRATRRSLREGKSQSLILLTGLEPGQDSGTTQAKVSEHCSCTSFQGKSRQRCFIIWFDGWNATKITSAVVLFFCLTIVSQNCVVGCVKHAGAQGPALEVVPPQDLACEIDVEVKFFN